MTIIEAALVAIKALEKPSSANEIYEKIIAMKLYEFGAKDPLGLLRSELRRHCIDFQGKTKSARPCLTRDNSERYTIS